MLAQNTSSIQASSPIIPGFIPEREQGHSRKRSSIEYRTQTVTLHSHTNQAQSFTLVEACYACHVAHGVTWPKGAVDDACEAHQRDCPYCPRDPMAKCPHCCDTQEIFSPNLFVHHYFSAPYITSDELDQDACYVLDIASPEEMAGDEKWLANVIERSRTVAGNPLSIRHLVQIHEYILSWIDFEPDALYWHPAVTKITEMIAWQMQTSMRRRMR